jgi:G3E family GTPase
LRIPTIVISGGLGSGKTTFIRKLVASNPGVRFCAIVNEFGEVGIDGALLATDIPQVVELRNGCICCVSQDQIIPTIRATLSQYSIEVLIVEMSGVGEPGPVIRQLEILQPMIEMRAHLTLVDLTLMPEHATSEPSIRNALAIADAIIQTKRDIAGADAATSWRNFLTSFNGSAAIFEANRIADINVLLSKPRKARRLVVDAPMEKGVSGPHPFRSICEFVGPVTTVELYALVTALGEDFARIKGIVELDGFWSEVQAVRGILTRLFKGKSPAQGRLVFISHASNTGELYDLVRRNWRLRAA